MKPETIPIKRYPNRRFYDRASRKYVTLQEIEHLVQEGHTIDVRDSKTDEDLTRVILTQIILERHPAKMDIFPIAMLHNVLRANDLVIEFMRNSMLLSLATVEGLQSMGVQMSFAALKNWMEVFFPAFRVAPRDMAEVPPERPEAVVEPLAQKMAELEERIRRLESVAVDRAPRAPSGGRFLEASERRVRQLEGASADKGQTTPSK
jgi:polyhydroxyalkanoate synthesis repressor PhaR